MSLENKNILDVCCGSKMFWFDKNHPNVIYLDNRKETHNLKDSSSTNGVRKLIIEPDVIGDFRKLDYPNDSFSLVVFDPPHLIKNGETGWLAKKYGKLTSHWRDDLSKGFSECFRVLKPEGFLIFKWNETDIRLSEILKLTNVKPLFGNQFGKSMKSHWIVFMKGEL